MLPSPNSEVRLRHSPRRTLAFRNGCSSFSPREQKQQKKQQQQQQQQQQRQQQQRQQQQQQHWRNVCAN